MAVPPVLLRSCGYSNFGAHPIQIYNLLILHTNLLSLAIRPFTHIDRKPLRHVTFFQKIKCRGQNSFTFCPRTFHSDNHIRKCTGHSPDIEFSCWRGSYHNLKQIAFCQIKPRCCNSPNILEANHHCTGDYQKTLTALNCHLAEHMPGKYIDFRFLEIGRAHV